jgi:hypothetical protein
MSMNRIKRVLSLYAEIREVVGDRYPPVLVMNCAESLDKLANGSTDAPEYSLRTGGLSLEARGLDCVFDQGGWALAGSGHWDSDDSTADCADYINTRSIFASIERGVHP